MPVIDFTSIAAEIDALPSRAKSATDLMNSIVRLLAERLPHYNWVGFYMLDPHDANMLVLGPFVGAPTPHVRIPLHQGICGAAASTGETIVVDDVNSDPRYLSCSIETRSEIVAPVRAHGKVVGELDIDSHTPAAFTPKDREVVEHAAAVVSRYLEQQRA